MEVESEYGEGKEKEVLPSPSHAVHGLIWVLQCKEHFIK